MAILVLVLWLATAVAGMSLLRAGDAARQRGADPVPTNAVLANARQGNPPASGSTARIGAIPLSADGRPPPGPHSRVITPPGEHPLLEFSHPALALTGIACWTMFVLVHYRPLAWIAFGALVVTLCIGLGWLASNNRAAEHRASSAWAFPRRLVLTHGVFATCSIVLTVLTAVSASHS